MSKDTVVLYQYKVAGQCNVVGQVFGEMQGAGNLISA